MTRLIEKPSNQIAATVPIRATGIAIAGMSAVRSWPMNRLMTAVTIMTASRSENRTSRIAPLTNSESSLVTVIVTPSRRRLRPATTSLTAVAISTVFDLAWRTMPRLTTSRPLRRTRLIFSFGAKNTSATSPMRTLSETMSFLIAAGVRADASARTRTACSSDLKLPAGTSRCAVLSTRATSATERR